MRNFVLPILLLLTCPAQLVAETFPLRAGPLTMVFESDNAFLRYIKVGEHEILRGINAPIRNQFWGTVQPVVTDFALEKQADRFTITFVAKCIERDVDFRWHGTITGSPDGRVELIFDGEAHSDFKRNRIGFCVLHGPSAAGQAWKAENPQGEKSTGEFPAFISPHQPVKDLRAITHQITPDIWAKVQFEGDVFEMEDQRNWTDASFKTYCTPLAIPYPVQVNKGDKVYQRIVISLEGDLDDIEPQSDDNQVLLTLGEQKFPIPRLGLQVSSEVDKLTKTEIQRLRDLKLHHLRVNLSPAEKKFARKLRQAARQAKKLEATLHVGLHLGEHPEYELSKLAEELKKKEMPISVLLVDEADQKLFQLTRKILKPHIGDALIGTSQDTNYVELNRARPEDEQIEVVSFGVNPQIHAIDNASIIETLPIQGDAVRSANQFIGKRQLIVGPITFKPQPINQKPAPGELPSNVDARQPSLFVGGWTLGSIKYLAEANATDATYFETVGWKGIMEAEAIPERHANFPSSPGQLFTAYHVFQEVADFVDGEVVELESSDPLSVVGLALTDGKRMRLLVANLTGQERSVAVSGIGEDASVGALDSTEVAPVPSDQSIGLAPFEIVRIDWDLKD